MSHISHPTFEMYRNVQRARSASEGRETNFTSEIKKDGTKYYLTGTRNISRPDIIEICSLALCQIFPHLRIDRSITNKTTLIGNIHNHDPALRDIVTASQDLNYSGFINTISSFINAIRKLYSPIDFSKTVIQSLQDPSIIAAVYQKIIDSAVTERSQNYYRAAIQAFEALMLTKGQWALLNQSDLYFKNTALVDVIEKICQKATRKEKQELSKEIIRESIRIIQIEPLNAILLEENKEMLDILVDAMIEMSEFVNSEAQRKGIAPQEAGLAINRNFLKAIAAQNTLRKWL